MARNKTTNMSIKRMKTMVELDRYKHIDPERPEISAF